MDSVMEEENVLAITATITDMPMHSKMPTGRMIRHLIPKFFIAYFSEWNASRKQQTQPLGGNTL
jgi:hypothetical protein